MKNNSVGNDCGRSDKELWRVAVHEAAHWIFSEWAGVGNVEGVTIIPSAAAGYVGCCHTPMYSTGLPGGGRLAIMMLCAGRAAENVLTGTRRYLDGTDWVRAHGLAGGNWFRQDLMVNSAIRRVEEYIRTTLYVPILTAASLLYEAKTIGREDAREIWFCVQPADWPWFLPEVSTKGRKGPRE